MPPSPLQFAVVREDPDVECALVARSGARRVALVASGGCTALTLASRFPGVALTLVDPNPAQLAHVRAKLDALRTLEGDARLAAFNVGTDDGAGLSARGNFEALFRGLRDTLRAFVASPAEIAAVCAGEADAAPLIGSRYWPAAFAMWLSDALLHAMFGPDATQHAPPGSYPAYFRARIERGLADPARGSNRFLHHVLLGGYVPAAPPPWIAWRPPDDVAMELVHGTLADLDPAAFDLLHLSNVFDWMGPAAVEALAGHVATRARPGTVVTWRQLNNDRDLAPLFPGFDFDPALEAELLAGERSLFYARLRVGVRRAGWTR